MVQEQKKTEQKTTPKFRKGDEVVNNISSRKGVVDRVGHDPKDKEKTVLFLMNDRFVHADAGIENWRVVRKLTKPGEEPHKHLENFNMKFYEDLKKVVQASCKLLYPNAITISTKPRKAKDDGEKWKDHGSIWFNCSKEELEIFKKVRNTMYFEKTHGLKPMTKDDIIKLGFGEDFVVMWFNGSKVTGIIDCVKINVKKPEQVNWVEIKDKTNTECWWFIDSIGDNGEIVAEDEIGYFYIKSN